MEDKGIKTLALNLSGSLPNLQTLILAGNEFTVKSTLFLVQFLVGKGGLKKLSLAENELKTKGVKTLAALFLKYMPLLEELDFSDNQMKSEAAIAIVQYLIKNQERKNMKSLNLNNNLLSEDCIDQVKELLEKRSWKKALESLEDNDADGADASDDEDDDADEDEDAALNAAVQKLTV